MNRISIVGNLTRDSELKYTGDGKPILKFAVACNEGRGDYAKVSFFNCTLFGKLCEPIAPYMKKGTKVFCQGKMEQRHWQAKDGTKKTDWGCVVIDMELIGSKPKEATPEEDDPFDDPFVD